MTENNHSSTALPVTEAPRVLVIGDIGQHTYHVGDEAMTIASAQALSEGGAAVTLMTRDVGHSAAATSTPATAGCSTNAPLRCVPPSMRVCRCM